MKSPDARSTFATFAELPDANLPLMEAEMQVSVNLAGTTARGSVISDAHFGLNFVADFESIGSRPWDRFDDIVANLDLQSLRYPGGITAETVFDYRNPNQSSVMGADGTTTKMTPLISYLEYCNREGINPTIIVPTAVFLTPTRMDNHRTFDEAQATSAYQFIEYVLSVVDPSLTVSFEIGNEYESHMSSTEYGRVANRLTEIIWSAIDADAINHNGAQSASEPQIFVQSWAYSVGGGLTVADLEERNARVISEFSEGNLAKIDGIVSHYYYSNGRNSGTDQAQTFAGIEGQVANISRLHSAWSDAADRDLVSRISEWNVQFRSTSELGLRQISPLMEMFSSFLENGVDALDFWSAQYHATSLASSSGGLMAAGTLFDILKPNLVGTQTGTSQHTQAMSTYTFTGDGRVVAVLSSEQASSLSIDLSRSILPSGLSLVDGYIIGVNEATADGVFRNLQGLQPYGEPDASITVTQIPITFSQGGQPLLNLDAFETLVLIFSADQIQRQTIRGSDSADLLYASGNLSQFVGRGGTDIVSYVQSQQGVFADLQVASDPTGNYAYDTFVSIEVLLGSSHNDHLRGSKGNERIDGWGGDDLIQGAGGRDTLAGGAGSDTIHGGSDGDLLRGGTGNDLLFSGGGQDSVFGDDGFDTLSFADSEQSVSFWALSEVVETIDGLVTFAGIEEIVGTTSNDVFDLGYADSTVQGLAGDDEFRVMNGGRHLIHGGEGNDAVFIQSGQATVYGGAGDDVLFSGVSFAMLSGGDGQDQIRAFGVGSVIDGGRGNDLLIGGRSADTFVFSTNSGHDTVLEFQPDADYILIEGFSQEHAWLEQSEAGSRVFLGEASSVLFASVFIDDLTSLKFVADEIVWA